MVYRSSLILLAALLFSSVVAADDAELKQSAEDMTQTAEDELSALEQTVGKQADITDEEASEAMADEAKAAEDEASSKPWLPAAKNYDWVQLTSGEWLKGEIKSMYNDSLDFDSDKLDMQTIDWEDVKYLVSYRPSNVNVEGYEPVTGNLQITEDKVTITDGEEAREFKRSDLISLAPSGDRELDLWSAKFSLGLNFRAGNTDQVDYNAKLNISRITARSRFLLDYIGNISKTRDSEDVLTETINNHRINASTSRYATRYFYYTPLFMEYYRDPFQNIDQRVSAGVGIGYTIFDIPEFEWNVNGGPAYVSTKYISVQPGEEQKVDSGAVVLATDMDYEITSTLDFIFGYRIQAVRPEAGGYTHHMVATFESEIIGNLDLDVSMIWDRISQPATDADGNTPEPDDYRLTIGVSYEY